MATDNKLQRFYIKDSTMFLRMNGNNNKLIKLKLHSNTNKQNILSLLTNNIRIIFFKLCYNRNDRTPCSDRLKKTTSKSG